MSQAKFLDKTLLAVANVAEQSLFSEAYALRHGFLQLLDVRIKLVSFLYILVIISFLHQPQTIWLLYGLSLVLAVVSRVPPVFFLKRVWLFVPLFSATIVLPALLNIVTPGDPVWVLVKLNHTCSWGPYTVPSEIAVTRQGLWGGIVFVSRVAVSVSFAVLFTLTTTWAEVFSDTRTRGQERFARLMDLVPALAAAPTGAATFARLRKAALADEDGLAFRQALADIQLKERVEPARTAAE